MKQLLIMTLFFALLACSHPTEECVRWIQVPVPSETKWCATYAYGKANYETVISEHLEYRCAEYKETGKHENSRIYK